MNEDTNSIIRAYLVTCGTLTALLTNLDGTFRIYCPRLPENCPLPALGFFTRSGTSTPYIPGLVTPSVQFDCWGESPQDAREIYRALYDVLQGIQREVVTVGVTNYIIWSAIEEVQGQDLQDEIQGYYRVLTFFSVMIRAE